MPPEINYVEYICIVSGRSKRHVRALAEFVRKVYKRKCHKTDEIPRIEGKDSDEWMALDLGLNFNFIKEVSQLPHVPNNFIKIFCFSRKHSTSHILR